MDNQPQQRFCTNCGQALAAGTAYCVACGTPVNAPPAGAQGYAPPSVPALTSPAQTQDEFLMAALAAGLAAQQAGQTRQQGKRSRMGLSGWGCVLLLLVVLVGPFIGLAVTTGRLRVIFALVVGGLVLFFFLFVLLANLMTRSGREAVKEGAAEGCLDAILSLFLGS